MSNVSYWNASANGKKYDAIREPAHYDVVIVGGGITGLTAAYLLTKAGKRVCVLEKDRIGAGETSHTSAHLTYVTDLWPSELQKRFGDENAALVWRGGSDAIDLIESIVLALTIDCDFLRADGFLYASPMNTKDESDDLKKETDLAVQFGFPASFMATGPVVDLPAIRFPNQALFHPLKYVTGLAEKISGDFCTIHEQSEATEFHESPLAVVANGYRITCDDIVLATHVPLAGINGTLGAAAFQTKLFPYSSYVLHAVVPSNSLAPGLYSDTANPYYYLRVHETDGQLHAIFGGQDHKTGKDTDTDARVLALEAYFLGLFPDAEITQRWSGQVIETADGLPYIGESAPHQYIATGYSGNGLTFGTLAAMIIRDVIENVDNQYRELFEPSRKKWLTGFANIIAENANYPLHLISDRFKPHNSAVDALARGDGAVFSIDGKRVAVHRKDDNSLVAVSATCTHLGCLVRWNQSERTWDCPCHGSRFQPDGQVIGGPAETALEKVRLSVPGG